jgi:hypothetical protein
MVRLAQSRQELSNRNAHVYGRCLLTSVSKVRALAHAVIAARRALAGQGRPAGSEEV